jgi:hypothetical protein
MPLRARNWGGGLANVLAQSEIVVRAFGPRLGFVLMSMAILASGAVTAGLAIVVAKGLGRVFGLGRGSFWICLVDQEDCCWDPPYSLKSSTVRVRPLSLRATWRTFRGACALKAVSLRVLLIILRKVYGSR